MDTTPTWAQLISDLQAAGMTYAQIGEAAGIAGSTVGDLASGRSKSPRGDAAVKLMRLHAQSQTPADAADQAKAA
jgi:transcriptional regulator with XRE-family HTH domain